mgnify:CR=1 FL=1
MKKGKTTFLKLAVVTIGSIFLILCIFWLPWLARNTVEMNPEYGYLRYPVLIGVYTTVIPFYIALYQALKILNLIENESAFSELAVESLKYIKYCAITLIILYVIGLTLLGFQDAFHSSIVIIGAIIIFAASAIALFAAVLQELLINALEIKSENDLTV